MANITVTKCDVSPNDCPIAAPMDVVVEFSTDRPLEQGAWQLRYGQGRARLTPWLTPVPSWSPAHGELERTTSSEGGVQPPSNLFQPRIPPIDGPPEGRLARKVCLDGPKTKGMGRRSASQVKCLVKTICLLHNCSFFGTRFDSHSSS